jgi:hypothetical protein
MHALNSTLIHVLSCSVDGGIYTGKNLNVSPLSYELARSADKFTITCAVFVAR